MKYLLSLVIILFSINASASSYWQISVNTLTAYGASAGEACSSMGGLWADYNSTTLISTSITNQTPTFARCNAILSNGNNINNHATSLIEGTCPAGYTDNGSGNCVVHVECTIGATTRSYHTFAELDSSPPDPTVNIDGCEYFSTNVEDCGVYENGDKACYYAWEATGEPAPSAQPEFEPPLPDIEKVNELERCKVGDFAGTFNGESMCISPSGTVSEPQPYVVNGEKTISDTVTTSNPDGTKNKNDNKRNHKE